MQYTACICKSSIMAWFTGFYQSPSRNEGYCHAAHYYFHSYLQPPILDMMPVKPEIHFKK
jgi:hypothetical protein